MTVQYEITKNEQFNSIEIHFDGKPSEAVRAALKALKFRWHGLKGVWYGYTDEETIRKAIEHPEQTEARTEPKKQLKNKYGVKVGDIFSASWGYDQTNVDFFQVVALVGETSVRVREVCPPCIEEKAISGMSSDRTYKLTREILPPCSRSSFIENQEQGDIKRIKPGYDTDPEKAKENAHFKLASFADAWKCNGETITEYVSWYA